MSISNRDRIERALEQVRQGLAPFVEREVNAVITSSRGVPESLLRLAQDEKLNTQKFAEWDVAALMRVIIETWNDVFKTTLSPTDRSLAYEIRSARNNWAHQKQFSSDDADRALDSMERLLASVSSPLADEIRKSKLELRRTVFDEQSRFERRKLQGPLVEASGSTTLKPWREIITPHPDVSSGNYQQAEFAADLWQVHLGEGSSEYRDPTEFFRRTYLTQSLRNLLKNAHDRLAMGSGDPVIQLQTNFGGGKTHSMLALYHLFSGIDIPKIPGLEEFAQENGITSFPKAKRVVFVGNKVSPGNPIKKEDGTIVRTIWGEIAWQLGGREAYNRIAQDDERATNPGDALRELFNTYGPCLILIDEWVAYARQLHDNNDLPAGSFETQFSFAQALSESAKLAKNCLLVVSLPASDTSGSPHTQADDVEVGGMRGRESLDRLRNVIGRLESSWRPATAEEGFEIVRRRLFQPLAGNDAFIHRDAVVSMFMELYRSNHQEFPPECREASYEKRLRDAYPIHPEVFDRLYTDWSTLAKFQRTRGVLRLMAAVIHSLWEKGDRNPLILPSTLPIDDPRVQSELTRYLSDNWAPIIESDVDGPQSLPLRQDSEIANLGKYHASRRVSRTVYLGSAPISNAPHKGLEDRRVKLGCVMPGEQPAIFGDALRRLSSVATYLYADGNRYWYATQPTVTKLADDRAEQLKRDPDKVLKRLQQILIDEVKRSQRSLVIHVMPSTTADVPDEPETRLVVFGPELYHNKSEESKAAVACKNYLETRGGSPRKYRNALVFLAPDKLRWQDLDEAIRKTLAWESILDQHLDLELGANQMKQAHTQRDASLAAVKARLSETYQWLIHPTQASPSSTVEFESLKLVGGEGLFERTEKKMIADDLMANKLAPSLLRSTMDQIPLWRGDSVSVRQLVEDFFSFVYLQRLTKRSVLERACLDGAALQAWQLDSFALAELYDAERNRYKGLIAGSSAAFVQITPTTLLVKPAVAEQQFKADAQITQVTSPSAATTTIGAGLSVGEGTIISQPYGTGSGLFPPSVPRHPIPAGGPTVINRYYASAQLDPLRVARDAGNIAQEVVRHLTALPGAKVQITMEINVHIPGGVPDNVLRIVKENGNTLKFLTNSFEKE